MSASDIERLVSERVAESRRLDYKRELPGNSDGDKREFLADVSSFANSTGGLLILGVECSRGIPEAICPVATSNAESEILRLEGIVREGLDPRLAGIDITAVEFEDGYVFVVSVSRSWRRPHMVSFQKLSRFYSRNSSGKYIMDATEIRSEFLASETLVERIRKFRDDRLALFASNRFPVEGLGGPFTAIHLVPYSAFDPEGLIDLPDLTTELPPLRAGPSGGHYNFDGFLTSASADGGKHLGYVQMFRNGCLEIVDWSMFGRDRERRIPGVAYEREVVRGLSGYRNCLIRRGVTFPVAVMITLAGLEGWTMGVGQAAFPQDVTIDRPILVLPEALLEDDSDLPSILKPVFDTVWNATGWQSSHNYDTDGHWVGD